MAWSVCHTQDMKDRCSHRDATKVLICRLRLIIFLACQSKHTLLHHLFYSTCNHNEQIELHALLNRLERSNWDRKLTGK